MKMISLSKLVDKFQQVFGCTVCSTTKVSLAKAEFSFDFADIKSLSMVPLG